MDRYEQAQKLALLINCAETGTQIKDVGDISGYETFCGKYFVLSTGDVWSRYKKGLLKPYLNPDGYLIVDLRDGENRKQVKVHRLVAQAFIPNPDNLATVNHKDENKINNDVSNLEWMSVGDNVRYGTGIQRNAISRQKAVICVETGEIYPSVTAAAKAINGNPSNISSGCKYGWAHHGYHWEYAGSEAASV